MVSSFILLFSVPVVIELLLLQHRRDIASTSQRTAIYRLGFATNDIRNVVGFPVISKDEKRALNPRLGKLQEQEQNFREPKIRELQRSQQA